MSVVFLDNLHNCKWEDKNGDWLSCITSQYKGKGLVVIKDSKPVSVEYVDVCPKCGKKDDDV